jgi:hypothetical protein
MSQQETAQALVQVLSEHRDDLITMLVEQAPAAGSGYEQTPPAALRPRMASVVDACIASLARQDPDLLRSFMRTAAEQRIREGYSVDSLITLALFTEGALSDTAEIAFESAPDRRKEARKLIRALIAAAEEVLDPIAASTPDET